MSWLSTNGSFQTKLMLMLMSMSISTLILATAGFVWQQNNIMLENEQHRTEILAQATAYNLAATLAFGDKEAASDLLQALSVDHNIIYAVVHDHSGKVFSSYGVPPKEHDLILSIDEIVMFDDIHLGDINIISVRESWFGLWLQKKSLIAVIALIALLAAFLIAIRLQKGLTSGVSLMAGAMKIVRDERNYAVRVQKFSDDELGQLADGFNSMLEKIQTHETELDLKVRERTASLMRELEERERAEQARDVVLHALNQAGEGIMLIDSFGHVNYMNPAFSKVTGYQLEDFNTNESPLLQVMLLGEDDIEGMLRTLESEESWQQEMHTQRKDGSSYPASFQVLKIASKQGQFSQLVCILRDMTAWEDLESELRQAQKMEAIGVLVGGIAHDFNNLLAGMLGNVELARMDHHDSAKLETYLLNIESGGYHAAEMIRKMLAFARKDRVEFKNTKLNDFFQEALVLNKLAIPESVHIQVEQASREMWVNIDNNQIEQVLLNLINNAVDAVEESDSPTVHLELKYYYADAKFVAKYPEAKIGDYACLMVQDNGCGMDEDVQAKIFEPFYTTKEVGKGTGLGLSMIYGAVQRHHGIIELESSQGKGSVFSVYLPLCRVQNVEAIVTEKPFTEEMNSSNMVILLVDDDEAVRNTMQEILISLGFTTITAHDGLEAVTLFRQHEHQIDMMVTDLSMPLMGGVDAAMQIREINANLPIIFSTGCDLGNALLEGAEAMPNTKLLFKPFQAQELNQTINKLFTEMKSQVVPEHEE